MEKSFIFILLLFIFVKSDLFLYSGTGSLQNCQNWSWDIILLNASNPITNVNSLFVSYPASTLKWPGLHFDLNTPLQKLTYQFLNLTLYSTVAPELQICFQASNSILSPCLTTPFAKCLAGQVCELSVTVSATVVSLLDVAGVIIQTSNDNYAQNIYYDMIVFSNNTLSEISSNQSNTTNGTYQNSSTNEINQTNATNISTSQNISILGTFGTYEGSSNQNNSSNQTNQTNSTNETYGGFSSQNNSSNQTNQINSTNVTYQNNATNVTSSNQTNFSSQNNAANVSSNESLTNGTNQNISTSGTNQNNSTHGMSQNNLTNGMIQNNSTNGSYSNQTNSSNDSASIQTKTNEIGSNSTTTIEVAVGVPLPFVFFIGLIFFFWYRKRREKFFDETQSQTQKRTKQELQDNQYNNLLREFSKIPRNIKAIEDFLLDLQNKGILTIYKIKDSADELEKFEDLFLSERLGNGTTGTVFKAKKKAVFNEVYALKLFCEFVDVDEKETIDKIGLLIAEMAKLKDSHHAFIITVYGIAYAIQENKIKIGIVEELMDMDLKKFMSKNGDRLSLIQKFNIGGNLIKAFHDYHKKRYIHLDVKPANILINIKDLKVKIADMGAAIKMQSNSEGGVELNEITPLYSSPENLLLRIEKKRIEKVDPRNDIWSLGLILYTIFIGRFADVIPWIPFLKNESDIIRIIREEQRKKSEFCKENNNIHAKIIEMLNKFLQVDINSRLDPKEMLDTFFECRKAVLEEFEIKIVT